MDNVGNEAGHHAYGLSVLPRGNYRTVEGGGSVPNQNAGYGE